MGIRVCCNQNNIIVGDAIMCYNTNQQLYVNNAITRAIKLALCNIHTLH